jgi:uncharacterized protein
MTDRRCDNEAALRRDFRQVGLADDIQSTNGRCVRRFPNQADHTDSRLRRRVRHAKNGTMRPSEALALHRDELRELVRQYDVARPRIFGSVLTGTDTEDSDLDLLVDRGEATSLFTLAGLQIAAEKLLGVSVDVLTPPRAVSEIPR